MVLPPSIPNFLLGCVGFLSQGSWFYFTSSCFEEMLWFYFPFFQTNCGYIYNKFSSWMYLQWSCFFSIFLRDFCNYDRLILKIVVFSAMVYFLGSVLVVLTTRHPLLCYSLRLRRVCGVDFQIVFGKFGLVIVKLLR